MYVVGNIEYKKKSKTNLAIAKAFLSREIRVEMTDFVNYVLDTATARNAPPFKPESIVYGDNSARCPHCDAEMKNEPIFASELGLAPELNPDTECDIEERYLCPICGTGYGSFMAASFCCESMEVYQCHECQHVIPAEEFEDLLTSGDMPDEWWAVTPWLFEKLKKQGATVIHSHNLWGRVQNSVTSPLEHDDMILNICCDLEILEGQAHSWSKYV